MPYTFKINYEATTIFCSTSSGGTFKGFFPIKNKLEVLKASQYLSNNILMMPIKLNFVHVFFGSFQLLFLLQEVATRENLKNSIKFNFNWEAS